jgi:PqqD family protein of HPr-rel-A system
VIVFNEASGQTHILDVFSEWALREIAKAPVYEDELAHRLKVEAELAEDLARNRLSQVLEGFRLQGLIERVE